MRTATLAMLLVLASAAHAQIAHQTLYGGLTGPDLVQALRTQEAVPTTLGYGPARDSIYTWEQRTYGRLRCVYTGYQITIPLGPAYDASVEAYSRGINAEHTWPQSMGAASEPQQSDLHNLYPSREDANAARGNLPFGESPDAQTNRWYRLAGNQTAIPAAALPEWSELRTNTLFEPREDHKGNVARSMLYFYSRWSAANATYLTSQIEALVAWSEADPVDPAEWNRMLYVQTLQHNRNPFIVDPSLARRAFLPETIEPEPTSTYTVSDPAVGTRIQAGRKTIVRWTGPGVPTSAATVEVFLVAPGGAATLLGAGKNLGKLKVTVPAGTPTGSDYAFRVQLQGDPTVFGLSDAVAVFSPADAYTFSEPDADETWQRGTTHTVLWTAPAGGTVGGTVTVTLLRRNNSVVSVFAGEPDDGTFDLTPAANLAAGEFYLTVESESDRAYVGSSPRFGIARIELTAPVEGATWASGSSQTITWTTDGASAAGNVRQLSLRRVDGSYSKAVAINVPFANGARTVTAPADAPSGEYFVQLLYQITSGGALTESVARSSPLTVTNPAPASPEALPPLVAVSHFGSAVASADARETVLLVRGLAEGAEVGVFVTVGGDGGEHLLATGVVEGGAAIVAVPSEITVGGDDWYFGETAALALRVYGGAEAAVETRSVTLGSDGSVLEGVRLAAGDVVVVDAAKGGAVGGSSPAVFAVQGVSPNPAATSATVRFTSPSAVAATVVVYDLLGRVVETAFSGEAVEGLNEVPVSTGRLPAGVYVVRVTAGGESGATRVTVVR